ncbi:MAG: FAD-dependent monooxygenase [Gammaproteobacteria bacterium]|nr:FAD-dependent monooxygenase [Gammaproteobacteria bacterium]MBV9620435.1 FAD-dependent monooxygenase [Gammaproteobacteria bacterium]
MSAPLAVVGAGLAGALLALRLAQRGCAVQLYERRADPRQGAPERGRSINLALAARGLRALEEAGLAERVRPLLIPMRGRMVHASGAAPVLQPYGQRAGEVIYSVGRAALNRLLIEAATAHPGVQVQFGAQGVGLDAGAGSLRLKDAAGATRTVAFDTLFATDGAGSGVRASLAQQGLTQVRESWLDHDYKELTIPAARAGALEREALHIWPRGGFMLIALPNTDGSFTATLFLARHGPGGFESLGQPQAVQAFFAREFPDAVPLMPDLLEEFARHPQGALGTVHAAPWHVAGRVLLLGDAAHAIVPFHGQGMNAAFEDCSLLGRLLEEHEDWASRFAHFERVRRPDTEAIAQMALENYAEMRDAVLDATFLRRKELALALERRFPGRFIPRYAMVMFHPEIPYAEALRRGALQAQLLARLDPGPGGQADLEGAAPWLEAQLPPAQ